MAPPASIGNTGVFFGGARLNIGFFMIGAQFQQSYMIAWKAFRVAAADKVQVILAAVSELLSCPFRDTGQYLLHLAKVGWLHQMMIKTCLPRPLARDDFSVSGHRHQHDVAEHCLLT